MNIIRRKSLWYFFLSYILFWNCVSLSKLMGRVNNIIFFKFQYTSWEFYLTLRHIFDGRGGRIIHETHLTNRFQSLSNCK